MSAMTGRERWTWDEVMAVVLSRAGICYLAARIARGLLGAWR